MELFLLFLEPFNCGLTEYGHEVYDCGFGKNNDQISGMPPGKYHAKKWESIVEKMSTMWRSDDILNAYKHQTKHGLVRMLLDIKEKNHLLEEKMSQIKPDRMIVDHYALIPAIVFSGIAWARVHSASPLCLHPSSHHLPPAFLGLPLMPNEKKDRIGKDWQESCQL